MQITTESENGVLIAEVRGRIDGTNAGEFERAVLGAAGESEGAIVLDCENLSYISSAGLRAVLLIAKGLAQRNVAFALCSLSGSVKEVFEVSGFDRIIATLGSRTEALGAVGG